MIGPKESIAAFLQPIARTFFNIKVVITDLFSGYKDLIPTLFNKAIHLVCHLHGGRLLRRRTRHLGATLSKHKKDLEKVKSAKSRIAMQIRKLTPRIAFLEARIQKDQARHATLSQKRNTAQSTRTKTLDHQLDVLSKRLQKDNQELATLRTQLVAAKKLAGRNLNESRARQKQCLMRKRSLQSSRLVNSFVRLLRDFSSKFEDHKAKFIARLEKSSYSMAQEILKMIRDNPDLFSIRNPRLLQWNFQNTNTIEGIFAKFRRFLDVRGYYLRKEAVNVIASYSDYIIISRPLLPGHTRLSHLLSA